MGDTAINPVATRGFLGPTVYHNSVSKPAMSHCAEYPTRHREASHKNPIFEEFVGQSASLQKALRLMETIAPNDTTVLVLGETGTGKELVARAIHKLSSRCGHAFIKLNCAAIPFDLLESELFGHEKGTFTGAIAQKIGRFELADKGTLFLDEIGDIPLALQTKLLRVLQEREFERLGSGQTHKVDVRLVAATHRDLEQMVKRNEFRSDLYYRLNVFPVLLPPLRARREDIPALVTHFVAFYGRQIGKRIHHIPEETMSSLTAYAWPGNVRELQNLIERAVILSCDGVLAKPVQSIHQETVTVISSSTKLKDVDRALILQALEAAGWRVGGPGGAAEKLGVKRTTLFSKMDKLGIVRPVQKRASAARIPTRLQRSDALAAANLETPAETPQAKPPSLTTIDSAQVCRGERELPPSAFEVAPGLSTRWAFSGEENPDRDDSTGERQHVRSV